jgi:2-polyprenyl-3-methyl-5-hydroxy-6-metoxy-1,4-benzoquinol methylase
MWRVSEHAGKLMTAHYRWPDDRETILRAQASVSQGRGPVSIAGVTRGLSSQAAFRHRTMALDAKASAGRGGPYRRVFKRVLDIATGSGLVALAAAKAGAADVLAADIDRFCRGAVMLNAAANGVAVPFTDADLTGADGDWDVVLAGDVFYDREMTASLLGWFDALAAGGASVLVGDPGRSYLPRDRLSFLAEYQVPVTRALEDAEVKRTTVWRYG